MPTSTECKTGVKVSFTAEEIGDLIRCATLAYLGMNPDSEEIGFCATPVTEVTASVVRPEFPFATQQASLPANR